jgi:hypothetical protein
VTEFFTGSQLSVIVTELSRAVAMGEV